MSKVQKEVQVMNKKDQNRSKTLRRLVGYYKEYKWRFLFTVLLAFFAAACATAAIVGIGYLYDQYFANPNITPIPGAPGLGFPMSFVFIIIGMIVIYLISNIFTWLQNVITIRFSEKASFKLRKEVFRKLHTLPVKYFDQTPSGELMSRVSNDIDSVSQLVTQYVGNFVFWILCIVFNLVVMFLVNAILALVVLIIIPIMIGVNLFIVKKIKPYFTRQQNKIGKLNGFAEEMVSGTKIVSLFKMQDPILKDFDKINDELTKDSIVAQTSSNLMMPINTFIGNLAFILIAMIGISSILVTAGATSTGLITDSWICNLCVFGDLFAQPFSLLVIFTMFARNFTNPINQIISSMNYLFLAIAGAERVFQIIDEQPEKDKKEAQPLKEPIKGKVEAKKLYFGYEENQMVLKDLNFVAKAGQSTAIVGPTGAGKTTIVNLITKFYNLNSGQLLIDGVPIEDITMESLRKNITMVLQETYLFGQTVKENIRYGRLDSSDEEIIEAAKEANAHQFIMQLPHGYDTVLSDNGGDLSQGQRQLLAIARSFLAKPKIVILDEATSSIDTKTELLIGEAMDKLMKGKTSFTIAHRLSTIKNADQILVLKDGTVIESGKHDELMAKNGFYADLYNTQFKKGKAI